MSTHQKHTKTIPTEKELSPSPILKEESTENKARISVAEIDTLEAGKTSGDNSSRGPGRISPCLLTSVYSALIVNVILTAAVIIILGILIKGRGSMQVAIVAWFIMESAFRIAGIIITARKSSTSYLITHSLGIFLGKEYYITLINSLLPNSDPFDAIVNRPGLRISLAWLKLGSCYVLYNLLAGITLWVVTWKDAETRDDDNYTAWLAIAGLIACLINIVNYFIGIIFATSERVVHHRNMP